MKAYRTALTEIFSDEALNACFPEQDHSKLAIYVSPLASEKREWFDVCEDIEQEDGEILPCPTGYITNATDTIKLEE